MAGIACTRRRFLLGAASLLGSQLPLPGQEETTFSTDVKVVNVLATVHAKNGAIIHDLGKDDFVLAENNRPQTIRYFSRESDLPLTIGLMVDTSMSQEHVLDAERGASMRFLDQVLREDRDKVFIMQFDTVVVTRQALTSSRKDLGEALAFVETQTRRELSMQGGGTLLYDAIVQASRDIMQKQGNRKALIVLTDGVDVGSDGTLASAIEAAQRADTLVYSILFSDPHAYGPFGGGGDGRGVLLRLSRETGGGFFEVSRKQGIEHIFGLIQEELRSQYSLGFISDEPVRISEFRRLRLTTKQKGLVVQSRDVYWAKR